MYRLSATPKVYEHCLIIHMHTCMTTQSWHLGWYINHYLGSTHVHIRTLLSSTVVLARSLVDNSYIACANVPLPPWEEYNSFIQILQLIKLQLYSMSMIQRRSDTVHVHYVNIPRTKPSIQQSETLCGKDQNEFRGVSWCYKCLASQK